MCPLGSRPAPERRRILVVDDEPDVRALLKHVLLRGAFAEPLVVDTAFDTEEALLFLSMREYSLLLTDLRMPGPDGLSLVHAAKEHWPGVSRAIMTAYPEDPRVQRACAQGEVAAVIPKPCRIGRLMETVDALARGQDADARPLRIRS